MCKRCADKNDDPRHNAFQPFFMLVSLSQAQSMLAQRYMNEGASADKTIHLEQHAVSTEDEAKAKMQEMEDDPTVAKFTLEKVVVVLN